jgi:Uma2 family endonuclease
MMSPATLWHSQVIRRLANALEASGLPVSTEVGVKRSDRSTRIADVAIFKAEPTNLAQAYWAPADLSVVIEVVSDGSEDDDHMYKPLWYAQAGIPGFWRVEQGEDGGAVIYKQKLARTADGHAAYIETGVTTLSVLESGS